MKRTAPNTFAIGEVNHIWARPDGDLLLEMDFGKDVSTWTFKIIYEEHEWPYMPNSYDTLTPGEITSGFTFEDNEEGDTNALMKVSIDSSTINGWKNKKLDFRLQVFDGTNTWIAADRTLTVAQGD